MDNNTEITIECPNCRKNLDIKVNDIQELLNKSFQPQKEKRVYFFLFLTFSLISVILFCVLLLFYSKSEILKKTIDEEKRSIENAKKEIDIQIKNAKTKAKEIINDSQTKADKIQKEAQSKAMEIINNSQTEADKIQKNAQEYEKNLESRKNAELNNLYPSLYKYNSGRIIVKKLYIESFKVSDDRVQFQFLNNNKTYIQPNFDIYFLDDYGFIVGEVGVHWLFDSIDPGKERIEEAMLDKRLIFNFNPTYFVIKFR